MLIPVTSNHRQTIRSYGHLSMDLSNGQTIEQEETRQVTIVLTIFMYSVFIIWAVICQPNKARTSLIKPVELFAICFTPSLIVRYFNSYSGVPFMFTKCRLNRISLAGCRGKLYLCNK